MITMFDSTEVSQIPSWARAVACYLPGALIPETCAEVSRRWPHAKRVSVAVTASEDADILDIENGDATVADAPGWFRRKKTNRGFYIEASRINELYRVLERSGIHRSEYVLWSAHYTGVPHLNGPSEEFNGESLLTYADATQYFDKALGRNLDISICTDVFFGAQPKHFPIPGDEVRWEAEWDKLLGKRTPWAHLRRLVLKRTMVNRERDIVTQAWRTGWAIRDRHDRYRKLFVRTKAR